MESYFKKKYRTKEEFRKYINEQYVIAFYAPWVYFEEGKVLGGWKMIFALGLYFVLGIMFLLMALSTIGFTL